MGIEDLIFLPSSLSKRCNLLQQDFCFENSSFFLAGEQVIHYVVFFQSRGADRHGRSDPEKRRLYDMGEPVRCLDSCTVTERAEQSRAREGNHFLRNVAECFLELPTLLTKDYSPLVISQGFRRTLRGFYNT